MLWEAFGSAALGLAVACAAAHWLPGRFRDRSLALATGPAAALVGGVIARVVLGPGNVLPTLGVAVLFSAAILSVLVRPGDGRGGGPAPGRPRVGAA